jgi:hypothetical protein
MSLDVKRPSSFFGAGLSRMAPIQRAKSFSRPFNGSGPLFSQPATTQSQPPLPPKAADETMTTVLVGSKQRSFKVNRELLCAASPFFRARLQTNGSSTDPDAPVSSKPVSLWLPGESSSMFSLFVEWLHARTGFRSFLDDCIENASDSGTAAIKDFHWTLVRLHLFASHLSLFQLQDLAMDTLQDIYLKFDWDVTPDMITHLYTQCEAIPAVRLRRFAVAMVAFSLAEDEKSRPIRRRSAAVRSSLAENEPTQKPERNSGPEEGLSLSRPSGQFQNLFDAIPEFAADYATHMRKMNASGLDIRFKNPQLRIYANRLRNDERAFGFRQCSFHSHRASVGERPCPHTRQHQSSYSTGTGKGMPKSSAKAKMMHSYSKHTTFASRLSRMSAMLGTVKESTATAVTMEPGSARAIAVGGPRHDSPDAIPRPLFSELESELPLLNYQELAADMPQPLFSELPASPAGGRHSRSFSMRLR